VTRADQFTKHLAALSTKLNDCSMLAQFFGHSEPATP
jgi:hypothetical protein